MKEICEHECMEIFDTSKIDECKGEAYNRCYGIYPMMLEVWYQDKDGTETYYDNWIEIKVNYCPYCGQKSRCAG